MTYDQVIRYYKGVSQAARELGFTRPGVYHWRDNGISLKTQRLIEFATAGKLKAEKVKSCA